MNERTYSAPLGFTLSKNSKFFYGWHIVIACFIGIIVSYPTFITYAFGVFIKPLNQEFGWSRTEITGALSLSNLLIIFAAPLCGYAIDRYGARRTLLPSLAALMCIIASLSFIGQNLAVFYLIFFILPFVASGTLPSTYTRFIVSWFDKHRGITLGISLAGVGIGAVILPILTQYVVTHFGWRMAYLAIAAIILFGILPLCMAFMIDDPKSVGLQIDGLNPAQCDSNSPASLTRNFTINEVLGARTFWVLLIAFTLLGMFTVGIAVHMVPMLSDRGIPIATAARALSLIGIFLILGRIIAGLLLDRFPAPLIAFICLVISSAGVGAIAVGATDWVLYAAIAAIGFGIGAEFDFMSYFISRSFGMVSYGKVYGILYGGFQFGGALGPLLMAFIFEASGSYTQGLWCLFAAIFCASILFYSLSDHSKALRGVR